MYGVMGKQGRGKDRGGMMPVFKKRTAAEKFAKAMKGKQSIRKVL